MKIDWMKNDPCKWTVGGELTELIEQLARTGSWIFKFFWTFQTVDFRRDNSNREVFSKTDQIYRNGRAVGEGGKEINDENMFTHRRSGVVVVVVTRVCRCSPPTSRRGNDTGAGCGRRRWYGAGAVAAAAAVVAAAAALVAVVAVGGTGTGPGTGRTGTAPGAAGPGAAYRDGPAVRGRHVRRP